MGTNYYVVKKKPTIASPLHIGKSSAGWKFSFQEVKKYFSEYDYDLEIHTYNQWLKFLEDNVGYKNNGEYVILNEYDEEVSLKELLDLIDKKQKIENPDDFTYSKNVDGYSFTDVDFC